MDAPHILYYFLSVAAAFTVKGIAGFGDPLISTPCCRRSCQTASSLRG